MTEERLVLAELLEKAGESDFLRAVAEAVLQLLMESDVEGLIGAGRYEHSGEQRFGKILRPGLRRRRSADAGAARDIGVAISVEFKPARRARGIDS
jgi:transposase-like protein